MLLFTLINLKNFLAGTEPFKYKTIIRHDRNHISKIWSEVPSGQASSINKGENSLFSKALGQLVDCSVFETVYGTFGCMLILVSSASRNDLTQKAEVYLNKLINGKLDTLREDQKIEWNCDAGYGWEEKLLTDVQRKFDITCDESLSNPYFDLSEINYLTRLAHKYVLWTGVLIARFSKKKFTATSAHLESYHNTFKTNVLDKKMNDLDEVVEALELIVDTRLAFREPKSAIQSNQILEGEFLSCSSCSCFLNSE